MKAWCWKSIDLQSMWPTLILVYHSPALISYSAAPSARAQAGHCQHDRGAVTKVLTHSLTSSEHKASWPGQLVARQLVVKGREVDRA